MGWNDSRRSRVLGRELMWKDSLTKEQLLLILMILRIRIALCCFVNCHREQVFRVKHRIKQDTIRLLPPTLSLTLFLTTYFLLQMQFCIACTSAQLPKGQYIESFCVPVKSMPCNSFTWPIFPCQRWMENLRHRRHRQCPSSRSLALA